MEWQKNLSHDLASSSSLFALFRAFLMITIFHLTTFFHTLNLTLFQCWCDSCFFYINYVFLCLPKHQKWLPYRLFLAGQTHTSQVQQFLDYSSPWNSLFVVWYSCLLELEQFIFLTVLFDRRLRKSLHILSLLLYVWPRQTSHRHLKLITKVLSSLKKLDIQCCFLLRVKIDLISWWPHEFSVALFGIRGS